MRTGRLLLLGCLAASVLACSKPAGGVAGADQPRDPLAGKWLPTKDGATELDWGYVGTFSDGKQRFSLKFEKDGTVSVLPNDAAFGSLHYYQRPSADAVVFTELVLGRTREDRKPGKRSVKLTVRLAGDELTLGDAAGKSETFKRKPPTPALVVARGLPLYSDKCAAALQAALGGVGGLSQVDADPKTKSLTVRIADEEDLADLTSALDRAGMHGNLLVNGQDVKDDRPAVVGGGKGPARDIVLKEVHACCGECQKALTDLARGAKVTFEGDGPTKTVTISGANEAKAEILLDLWRAGFKVKGGPH